MVTSLLAYYTNTVQLGSPGSRPVLRGCVESERVREFCYLLLSRSICAHHLNHLNIGLYIIDKDSSVYFVDAGVCRHDIDKDSSVYFCVCVQVIGLYVYHALWVRVVMNFE